MQVLETFDDLVRHLDDAEVRARAADLEKLRAIARLDRARIWQRDGCRDMTEWVAGYFKQTTWVARRWVKTAHALERLPATSHALATGRICLEKTIELARYVTPRSEARELAWAERVTPKMVRGRAERCERGSGDKVQRSHEERFLRYWDAGHDRWWVEALLPAVDAAGFIGTLDRIADSLSAHPDDEPGSEIGLQQRRADALSIMASRAAAEDADLDRANINVHAQLDDLLREVNGADMEGGPVIHSEVLQELLCDARIRLIVHEGQRGPIGLGHASRHPSSSLMRLLRHRDGGCVFPGCPQMRFVQSHHIVAWPKGPTNLDNLVLLCKVHHDLIHRYGWKVVLGEDGRPHWFRPAGIPFEPGVRRPRITEPEPVDHDAAGDWDVPGLDEPLELQLWPEPVIPGAAVGADRGLPGPDP